MDTFTELEKSIIAEGHFVIAGVDEAGRGPIAGPVVAAAVIFNPNTVISGINDSKKLNPAKRQSLGEIIKAEALSWAVGIVDAWEIDILNILKASQLAMKQAVAALAVPPDICLLDGYPIPEWERHHQGIIKGDRRCFTIAAASILAKTHRDQIMVEFHKQYPQYHFDRHKGYPTKDHRRQIRIHGPSPLHRMSFRLLPDE